MPGVDTERLMAAANTLTEAAGALRGGAGGVDRSVPAVPHGGTGLHRLLVALDEARQGFGAGISGQGAQPVERLTREVAEALCRPA